ncbi:hypothetical protein B0H14DRAFT_3454084 [Mycena olivaceomarginata]|nr:hypothetical protein B0H14DRAFT_3454084 [Mycena olivaceomarginata]
MSSDITKRRSHAEAQRRYREKNLEVTRKKARESARDPPFSLSFSPLLQLPPPKFGQQNFMEHYFPLYEERGTKHLPGVKIPAVNKSLECKDNIHAHRRK